MRTKIATSRPPVTGHAHLLVRPALSSGRGLLLAALLLGAAWTGGCKRFDDAPEPGTVKRIPGRQSLVRIDAEPPGAICASGGRRVHSGLDLDDDGVLDDDEIVATTVLCDGGDGQDGSDGQDGADGADGRDGEPGTSVLARTRPQAAGPGACAGTRVEVGADVDGDGVLDDAEVDPAASLVVCDGEDGEDGADGVAGTPGAAGRGTVLRFVVAAPGACATGGVRFEAGLDDDHDGVLDDTEVEAGATVCNGAAGPAGTAGTATTATGAVLGFEAAPGNACPTGGIVVVAATDANGNGALDPAEAAGATRRTVCNGVDGATIPPTSGLRVTSIDGDVLIDSTPMLDLIRDVTRIGGRLTVTGVLGEVTLPQLTALGALSLMSLQADRVSFPALRTTGDVSVVGEVSSLRDAFPVLVAAGDIEVAAAVAAEFEGFAALESAGDVTVRDSEGLQRITAFRSLTGVRSIRLSDLPALTGIPSFRPAGDVVDGIELTRVGLSDVAFLERVVRIGSSLRIAESPDLVDFTGLSAVTTLRGDFVVAPDDTNAFRVCAAFDAFERIAERRSFFFSSGVPDPVQDTSDGRVFDGVRCAPACSTDCPARAVCAVVDTVDQCVCVGALRRFNGTSCVTLSGTLGSVGKPAATCRAIQDGKVALAVPPTLRPDLGRNAFSLSAPCDQTTAGGGWTPYEAVFARALAAGPPQLRRYLLKSGSVVAVSPPTTALWSFTTYVEVPGRWTFVDAGSGGALQSVVCDGDGGVDAVWGIGCDDDDGFAVLPGLAQGAATGVNDPGAGTTSLCRQDEAASGGASLCLDGVAIFVREEHEPVAPVVPTMECAGGTCLDRFDVCPQELALEDDSVPVPNAACDNDPNLRVVDGRCVWTAPDTAPTTKFAVARANCARAGGVLAPGLPTLLADVESGGLRNVWAGVCQERYPDLGLIFPVELGIYGSYASLSGEPVGLDVTQETGGGCFVPRGGSDFNDIQVECASDLTSSACVFDRPGGFPAPGAGGSVDLRGSTSAAVAWPFDRTMPDFAGSAGLTVELRVFVHSQPDGGAHRTRLLRTPDWELVYSMTGGVSLRVNSTTSATIPASVLPTDRWVSLALTYSNVASGGSGSSLAGTLRLFVDGTLRGSARVGGTSASVAARVLRPTRHVPVQIGNGPDLMSLSVDDVRLWSRIRSDAEVLGDFDQKAIPADAPGLVAHFTFDETAAEVSAADRVLDRSGNGLGAELVNNARRGADSELP